jgi:hypothetical protein
MKQVAFRTYSFMFFLLLSFNSGAQPKPDEECFKWGMHVAFTWHKSVFCTTLHPTLVGRATETKKQVQAAYPKLYESLDKEQWSENLQSFSVFSVSEDKAEDPKFSLESCKSSVENLAYYVEEPSYRKALACWR